MASNRRLKLIAREVYTINQRLDGNHLGDECQGGGFLLHPLPKFPSVPLHPRPPHRQNGNPLTCWIPPERLDWGDRARAAPSMLRMPAELELCSGLAPLHWEGQCCQAPSLSGLIEEFHQLTFHLNKRNWNLTSTKCTSFYFHCLNSLSLLAI